MDRKRKHQVRGLWEGSGVSGMYGRAKELPPPPSCRAVYSPLSPFLTSYSPPPSYLTSSPPPSLLLPLPLPLSPQQPDQQPVDDIFLPVRVGSFAFVLASQPIYPPPPPSLFAA